MSTAQTQQNQPSAKVQLPKQQGERKGFTNQEIQTIEADRKEPEKWNVVHLLRDGNYWHANEWSAWLVAVVITSQMKRLHPDMEIDPPTPVKKFAKNINGEYIFVGFQEKSFDKYLPKELVLDWRDVEDGRIDVPIQMPDDHGELTYEPTGPCGACRQVIVESETRAGRPIRILLYGRKCTYVIEGIRALLPLCFSEF